MNILLLTSEFTPAKGGVGTYAREIAVAATELGAQVTVVAPDYGRDNIAEDRAFPFEVSRFHGGLHSMRDLPAKIRLAYGRIKAGPFDVVHAADWPFFIPVALSRWRTSARIVMTVHGTEINETRTPSKRLAIRGLGLFGPRTQIVANSQFTRQLFRERFGTSVQIDAIRLGVSEFWFGPANGRAATREMLGVEPDQIVMVTVARITRRKGHHLTLTALARLSPELRRRITWLVIGPDGEADYVEDVRRQAETVQCDVRFLGALPDEQIRDLYTAADFFCLTGVPDSSGRVEGFGLVYLEAAACGLPSVATAIGGVSDAVLAEETGLLVTPSIKAVALAITELIEQTEARAIFAAGASAHARALSWRRCAAETYRLSPEPRRFRPSLQPGDSIDGLPDAGVVTA